MTSSDRERQDWVLIPVMIVIGLILMILVGTQAIRPSALWQISADMRSNINPNSGSGDFPDGYFEQIRPEIQTPAAWMDNFLTPGANDNLTSDSLLQTGSGTPGLATFTPTPTATSTLFLSAATSTPTSTATSTPPPYYTSTIPYYPPTYTKTPQPKPTQTYTPTSTPTSTPTPTATTPALSADLEISKSDSSPTYTPGGSITYMIVVANNGPDTATGFQIRDTIPAAITIDSVTCVASGAALCGTSSGSGQNVHFVNASINAGAGHQITITINGKIAVGTSGVLSNTANIIIPFGAAFTDPETNNNEATDVSVPVGSSFADLSISKIDGVSTYRPGNPVTYTIIVSNAGLSDVSGATVTDTFSDIIIGVAWTCSATGSASCTTSGNNDINDSIDLPAGESVTYTVVANTDSAATAPLSNTATVAAPAGIVDPDTSNNSDTDTNTAVLYSDLSVTKDDGVTRYTPGGTLTYTIVVSNAGPSDVIGATLTDNIQSQIDTWGWCLAPCTPVANSSNNLSTTLDIPAGSSVTYLLKANIRNMATGTLVNTVSVTAPAGVTDAPGNNSDSDSDASALQTCDITIPVTATGNYPISSEVVSCLQFNGTVSGGANGATVSLSRSSNPLPLLTVARWQGWDQNVGSGACGDRWAWLSSGGSLSNISIDRDGSGNISLYVFPIDGGDTISISAISDWAAGCP